MDNIAIILKVYILLETMTKILRFFNNKKKRNKSKIYHHNLIMNNRYNKTQSDLNVAFNKLITKKI